MNDELRIIVNVHNGLVEEVLFPAGSEHVVVEVRDYDVPMSMVEPKFDWEHDGSGQWPVDADGDEFFRLEWGGTPKCKVCGCAEASKTGDESWSDIAFPLARGDEKTMDLERCGE